MSRTLLKYWQRNKKVSVIIPKLTFHMLTLSLLEYIRSAAFYFSKLVADKD
jgi:hypothetical protein